MNDNPSSADPLSEIANEFVEALRQGKRPSVEEFARRTSCSPCRRPEGDVLDATAYLILALGEQRRGRFVEARQALTRARALRERNRAQPEFNLFFDAQWSDWLRFDALHREAGVLIKAENAGPKS
jgi:hypothetical protein